MKRLLCQAPVLSYPNFQQSFILQTDASKLGVGAVLSQKNQYGHDHVLSYASRSLTEREKKFSTTEKEALAVVFAGNHFRTYLLGRKFSLITDHSALSWLHSIEAKGCIGRWVIELQEYDFDVKHRPGSDHGNADALSHLPNVKDSDSPILHPTDSYSYNCATTITPGYNLQAKQMEDPALSKIIQLKLDGFPKPPRFVWGHDPVMRAYWNCWDSLHVVNGLLVKSTGNNSFPQYAFVVPQCLIESVLQGIHCSPFSGHLGIKRSIMRTKHRFFWYQMASRIKEFVRSCETCAKNKSGAHHYKAPMQSIDINEPFVFWAMDYMGPLPETA